MKGKLFVSALFRFRNISFLALALAIVFFRWSTSVGSGLIPYYGIVEPLTSLAIYMALVLQSFVSKGFQDNFLHKQKVKQIKQLNTTCLRLYAEARKNTNQAYFQRLRKVMEDRNEIVNSFFRGERNLLKEKVVEQALNLVVSYIKLTNNFCLRSRELSTVDVSEVAKRINMNSRKLSFIKDSTAAEDIKRVIEMDERIINRLKEEKKDLERINTKLDYMESTINMFKHQMLSNIESEEMLGKLEAAVNEAEALDNVLQERRKDRMRS